jgi:hypothetical protein
LLPTIHTAAPEPNASRASWRGILRRHLTVLLLLKFAALALLWLLFFSPAHRSAVDARAVAQRLAAGAPAGGGRD